MKPTHTALAALSCLFVLPWIGCGPASSSKPAPKSDVISGTNASTDSAATATQPKIALVMKSLANEFFSTMADGAKKHHAEHKDQYELVVNGIKDERDLKRQAELIEEMVSAGAKAIVVAPADSKALIPALRRAQKAGVIVVNIDNKLDDELLVQEKLTIPFIGPNNKTGASVVGDYLAAKLKSGDEVLVLEGIRTSFNGTQRRLGFEESMKKAGVKVADSQSAQWEMNQANTIAASMLNAHPDVKAILAANDSMALGAVAAVKAAGKTEQVHVVGFDNISAAQQAIREGKMLATADQHADQLAVFGIEFALSLLADRNAKVQDKETPVDLVTAETITKN